jgi:hypothetical protein
MPQQSKDTQMSKPEGGYSNANMRGESAEELAVVDQIAKSFERHVDVLRGKADPEEPQN